MPHSDMPGLVQDMRSPTQDMSTLPQDMPSLTRDMPSRTDDMPSLTDDMHALTKDMSRQSEHMPSLTQDMPNLTEMRTLATGIHRPTQSKNDNNHKSTVKSSEVFVMPDLTKPPNLELDPNMPIPTPSFNPGMPELSTDMPELSTDMPELSMDMPELSMDMPGLTQSLRTNKLESSLGRLDATPRLTDGMPALLDDPSILNVSRESKRNVTTSTQHLSDVREIHAKQNNGTRSIAEQHEHSLKKIERDNSHVVLSASNSDYDSINTTCEDNRTLWLSVKNFPINTEEVSFANIFIL